MSKHKQAESLLRFIDLAKTLRLQRYRLAIVCSAISSGKSKIAQAASEELEARYIDLATELLPQTVMPNFSPTLGAYGPDDLIKWMICETGRADVRYLVIDQIEPLLATFGRAQVMQFFRMVSQAEPREPIFLITYLKKQIEGASFPTKRLLHL